MSSTAEEPTDKSALIGKVVRSLADDYHRRGGFLSGDHVLRAVEKRDWSGRRRSDSTATAETLESTSMIRKRLRFEQLNETDARSEDIVRRYLLEIGSIRLLKPQDETALARRIRQANRQLMR